MREGQDGQWQDLENRDGGADVLLIGRRVEDERSSSLLVGFLDTTAGGGARAAFGRRLGWRLGKALLGWGLLGSCDPTRQLREKLDGGHGFGLLFLEHLGDDVHGILDFRNGLALADVLVEFSEDVDRSLEGLASDRCHGSCSVLFTHALGDLAGELVDAVLLGLLQGDVVGGTWELGLDDIELAKDELDLADLPELLVVRSALVVLATEERPIGEIARASLVATEVVGNDLARERQCVLTGATLAVLVVHANKLTLDQIIVVSRDGGLLASIRRVNLFSKLAGLGHDGVGGTSDIVLGG